jgi:hypothetical protein
VPHFTKVEGLFAGVGIVLIGRAANGILGIDWLTDRVRLPWVAREETAPLVPPGEIEGAVGGRGMLGGEAHAG